MVRYSQKAVLWYCKYLWNYNTDQQEISAQYLYNENVSGDAVLWRHNRSKMADGRHLKIAKSPYLSEKSSDFDKIWYTTSDNEPDESRDQKLKFLKFKMSAIIHRPIVLFQRNFVWGSRTAYRQGLHNKKLQIFKIQDGGRPPFWKSLNRHISVKNHPILMKLRTLHQILNPMTVTWPKIEIFKIQDGGGHHLQNRFFGHYSSTECLISAKFCRRKQNGMFKRLWDKKWIFLKSKMADGHHFENR